MEGHGLKPRLTHWRTIPLATAGHRPSLSQEESISADPHSQRLTAWPGSGWEMTPTCQDAMHGLGPMGGDVMEVEVPVKV